MTSPAYAPARRGGASDRLTEAVLEALATVVDPELDEPITELGFVRSVAIDDAGVVVHLRLPTSFCSPNFAYLMASDSLDALTRISGIGRVDVRLDDHHDSDKINAGLQARAGYRGTFGVEAEDSLEALRLTFKRKAHTAAMERVCLRLLHDPDRSDITGVADLADLTLGGLPAGKERDSLVRRRAELGLPIGRDARVLVDEAGNPVPPDQAPVRLRYARAVRISVEGNAHFCRGLLATRYGDEDSDAMETRITNTRRAR